MNRRLEITRPRVALCGIVALAAVLYAWGIDDRVTHYYYSAAARSMSGSLHAFVFGAVDPDALVGLDKVPGALWVQATSAGIFGFHPWALALPEALAATGAVLLLYRLVRDWAETTAALVAAAAFALTPIVVAVARANVPDAILLFLLVLAAERCWTATRTGRLWPLLLSGLVVGLAFDVKMLQAGLILPALYLTYLVAAPGPLRRRVGHLAASAGVTIAVSAVWLLVVAATPASHRPYIGGTSDNSVLDLVFGFNGLSRLTGEEAQRLPFGGAAGLTRLGNEEVGGQIAWLLPFAALALVVGLYRTRRTPRTDTERAGYVLWGTWLIVAGIVFSAAGGIHPYYTAALAPAAAALFGAGFTAAAAAWRRRARAALLLPSLVAVGAAWAFALLRREPDYVRPAQLAVIGLGAAAIVLLVLGLVRPLGGLGAAAAVGCALGALLVAPAAWSLGVPAQAQTVWGAINPVAGPTPGAIRSASRSLSEWPLEPLVGYLRSHRGDARLLAAGSDAFVAGPLISATGEEVLPMGGLNGDDPFPTVSQLGRWVRDGELRFVLLGPRRPTPAPAARWDWTTSHCRRVEGAPALPNQHTLYDCG